MKRYLFNIFLLLAMANTTYGSSDFIEEKKTYGKPLKAYKEKTLYEQGLNLIHDKDLKIKGVVLVNGKNIFSTWIKHRTKAKVSHAALWLEDQYGQGYIYESTGSPKKMIKGTMPQVQIGTFDDVLSHYPGEVWIREIHLNDGYTLPPNTVQAVVAKYLGTPYTSNPYDLTKAVWHGAEIEKKSHIFCSQLVALVLNDAAVGLLPEDTPSGNYLPKHFLEDKLDPAKLQLLNASWGDQTLIQNKDGERIDTTRTL